MMVETARRIDDRAHHDGRHHSDAEPERNDR
jgi:hypothetical protein